MKILIFFPCPKRGGIERNFAIWRLWLEGHEVIVYSVPDCFAKGVLRGYARLLFGYLGLLIRNRPDAVISFQFGSIALIAKMFSIPTFVRLSNDPSGADIETSLVRKISERIKRLSYRFADAIFVNSQELASRISGWNSNTHLIRNSLPKAAHTGVVREKDGLDRDLKLLFVGRISQQKNLAALVEAFHGYVLLAPNSTLTIIGDGELREDVKLLAEAGPGRDQIKFLGWQDEIAYRNFDVFVLPSLYEGSPNALLEAANAGLYPVITPFSSGGREVLDMLGYGTLARGFTSSDIADALAEIGLPSADVLNSGMRRLAREHDWERNKARLLQCLQIA
ncbi:glycosyltransferase [Pelagibacterium halotolerans]|uniref:glycosyltransferase n=1 Tax=Pelagibacterium halotolerans TaxID=531813 RepID=UPI0005A16AE4|nr:glycosyltransferase [Pelagibacterium halotolerans]QJR17216.1 glycosyltransferase [Pelagibacterium halotolerans]SEA88859.1 Glycosyltransferase involved in cell wall bisynthesis [Pelagibacterium halotolerans]